MKYLNIHTHKISKNENTISLLNVFPNNIPEIDKKQYYSIGIHPWYVSENTKKEHLGIVEKFLQKENFIACGEIGLDKNYPNFNLQKEIFIEQLKLAQNADKPVIIHNVKSSSEILSIIKKNKVSVPKIIHRYGGNITTARQFAQSGFYLSFGHALFNDKSKTKKVFTKLPLNNIFLETDDSEKSIEEIYKKAFSLRDEDSRKVKISLLQNYIDMRTYTITNQYNRKNDK